DHAEIFPISVVCVICGQVRDPRYPLRHPNRTCFAGGETYFPRMAVLEMTNDSTKAKPSGTSTQAADALAHPDRFARRHIGPNAEQTRQMLGLLGRASLDALIDEAVPAKIRLERPLQLPDGRAEHEVLAALKQIASQNQVFRSFIGMG